jgi:murein DD-endopeptidase MepM/ murein hydrolase activator NlpD
MLGFARGFVLGLLLLVVGWIGGSLYPAPSSITAPIAQRAPDLAARLGISEVTLDRLSHYMSSEQLLRLRREASALAAAAGDAILIERSEGPVDMQSEQAVGAMPAAATNTNTGAAAFETELDLCPGMTVTNAPAADANRRVTDYAKIVNVNGDAIAVAPTRGACLSSGFGSRDGHMHKGIDLHSADGGPILAAGDGVVIERKYRDDYGNMLLIDHGNGVYTRYAHLSSFANGVVLGAHVTAGQQLGLMGNTASYQIPVHLHYELLLGDYANPQGSFGLTPHSPFEFHAAT